MLRHERELGASVIDGYIQFSRRVHALKESLMKLLSNLRASGYRIAGYGAPARRATT